MFHVKHLRRAVCVLLCLMIITVQVNNSRQQVKAFAFVLAAPAVYEILMTVLLSAGITIMTVDSLQQIKENEEWQEQIDSIISTLNEQDSGLGTAIGNAVNNMTLFETSQRLTISESLWKRLLSLSKSIATGTKVNFGYGKHIESTLTDLFNGGISMIRTIDLPLLSDGSHFTGREISSTAASNFNSFYALAQQVSGVESPLISCYYIMQNVTSTSGKWGFLYVASEGNVPITSYDLFAASGQSVKMSMSFNGGLPVVAQSLYFTSGWSSDYWTMSTAYGDMKNVATTLNLYNYSLGVNSLSNGDCIVLPLFQNSITITDVTAGTVAEFGNTVADGALDVITAGRTYTDTGEMAGDVVIDFPVDLPSDVVLDGVADGSIPATDALERVGVIPVDLTDGLTIPDSRPIPDVIDRVPTIPDTPDVGKYNLHLETFFPFCLPFDFAKFIGLLSADPQAPSFTIKLPTGFKNGITYTDYTVSLEDFDTVAYWLRRFELLAFIVGLIYVTRSFFIRS